MPAIITFENDALTPITSENYGSISGGSFTQGRFNATNTGNTNATNLQIIMSRITSNDGVDFLLLAPDVNGNPGTFGTNTLNVGTLIPGGVYWFWTKILVPANASPAGNPRLFNIQAQYSGT